MIKKAFLRAVRLKWNWILTLGIILAVFELFRAGEDTAACATIFWGSWLLVHRFIVAYKNEQLKDLYDRI